MASLKKNGHLFLSIFKNIDGEFYFVCEKTGLHDYALSI